VIRFAPQLQLALPTGRYGTVTFTIHQGTEARAIDATAQARFVAGNFVGAGMDGSRQACLPCSAVGRRDDRRAVWRVTSKSWRSQGRNCSLVSP
jgi:hypothetical protein